MKGFVFLNNKLKISLDVDDHIEEGIIHAGGIRLGSTAGGLSDLYLVEGQLLEVYREAPEAVAPGSREGTAQ